MAIKKNVVEISEPIKSYQIKQGITKDNGVLKRQINLSNEYNTAVLVFIGDWHIGSVDFDVNEAIKTLNYTLQTPNARLLCLGDMMNTAILNSVSNMYEDIAYPQEQWKLFVSLLKQVADANQLVVVHTGNHERRIGRNTGIDPVEQASEALGMKEAYAPYYADTSLVLKCPYTKSKKFSFPIVTHHGDSGNPENNASINQESLINAIGHTHNFRSYVKSKVIINSKGKRVKKDELNIIIPASGGGQYGYEKGYKPINKCPYYALEVTTTKNPLYDANNLTSLEAPVILATKSIPILESRVSKIKQEKINLGKEIVSKNIELKKEEIHELFLQIVKVFEDCGLDICEEIKTTLKQNKSKENTTNITQKLPKKTKADDWYINDDERGMSR